MKKTFESMFVQRNPKYEHLLPRMRAALGVEEVTFADINTANMRTFREYMKKQVTANSLSTYFAVLKATINENNRPLRLLQRAAPRRRRDGILRQIGVYILPTPNS